MSSKKTLIEARKAKKVEDFIKEHEADPDGDLDKLDALIKRPVQESGSKARPASPRMLILSALRIPNGILPLW